jgi:hypothetical protein
VRDARVVQDTLGRGGFTSIDVRHYTNVARKIEIPFGHYPI